MTKRSAKRSASAKIDIRHVATRAGVSIATVSRAFNRLPTVDPALAERVWKAVGELNYRPNTHARALVSGKTRLLGLIVSDITNPFFPEIIYQFERSAVERGYEILIGSASYEPRKMELCAQRMLERNVDGVAIMTFAAEKLLLERFAGEDIPIVSIDESSSNPLSARLVIDYQMGISEAVQHLAGLGHRKIAFISGPLNLRSAKARRTAFQNSLRSSGIDANAAWLIEGDHTLDGGRDAMAKMLAMRDRPTAIMCSNDMTAIGVQHALFEADLKVPDDFSLIGFDDIQLAEYTIPPLTTIRMSCRDIAQNAVRSLLSRLQPNGSPSDREIHIPTQLIVRRTSDFPKDAQRGSSRPSARRMATAKR